MLIRIDWWDNSGISRKAFKRHKLTRQDEAVQQYEDIPQRVESDVKKRKRTFILWLVELPPSMIRPTVVTSLPYTDYLRLKNFSKTLSPASICPAMHFNEASINGTRNLFATVRQKDKATNCTSWVQRVLWNMVAHVMMNPNSPGSVFLNISTARQNQGWQGLPVFRSNIGDILDARAPIVWIIFISRIQAKYQIFQMAIPAVKGCWQIACLRAVRKL